MKDDFVHNVVDRFFGSVFGYGHRPMRAVLWSLGLIVVASLFYGTIYERGQMAPSAAVIMASDEWRQAVAEGCPVT